MIAISSLSSALFSRVRLSKILFLITSNDTDSFKTIQEYHGLKEQLENIENQSKSLLELLKQSMDFRLFIKDPTSEKNEQIKSIEIIAEKKV